jgi:hemolysin III
VRLHVSSSTNASRAEVDLQAFPRLRGVFHAAALGVACVVGALFVSAADGPRVPAAAIFAASVVAMLTASALYHRVDWSPRIRPWMRRLDYIGIYVLIAGTYTCVGLVSLDGPLRWSVLGIVWGAAVAAALTKLCWIGAPDWLSSVLAIALGWIGVAALPQLLREAGVAAVTLLVLGGLAYTAGAVVYARQKPDPIPAVFGYHEVFHALTLVALACQYVAIAFFVVDVG